MSQPWRTSHGQRTSSSTAIDPVDPPADLARRAAPTRTAPTRTVPVHPAHPTLGAPAPRHHELARDQLDALTGVVEDLAGQFELRPLLDRILRHAAGLLDCSSGSICTVDEHAGTYRKEVDLGVACRSGREFPLTEGVTGEILRAGGPVTFAEYSQVRGGHIDPADRIDLHAVIGVPIRWSGAVIGACIVFSRDPGRRFGASDVTLLELFAGHAGLAMVNARLHAQAAELARAEATGLERERIVRDVHDSVARALASVVLHLGGADEPPRPAGSPPAGTRPQQQPPAPGRDRLDLARQAARTALTQTRRTVWGTHAPATVEQIIGEQVEWAAGTGMDIRLVVAGKPRPLPPEVVDQLSAVARHAVTVIVTQADARSARVGLVYGTDDVVLLIQDDGVGFDAQQLPRPDGSGRTGIRALPDRLELDAAADDRDELIAAAARLGGTMQVDATPGWGTTIRLTMPYRHEAQPPQRSTVLVLEHRPLVRAGLIGLLASHADLVQVVGEIDTADDLVDAYRLLHPDVVLIDVALPGDAALVTAQLRSNDPSAAVVAVGAVTGDPLLREMVRAGALAAVPIDTDGTALVRAIGAAARGDGLFTDEILHGLATTSPVAGHDAAASLTPRELQVRGLVSQGLPDKQIAERLHISVKTVEKHVGSALRKTGARNRTELAGMTGWAAAH